MTGTLATVRAERGATAAVSWGLAVTIGSRGWISEAAALMTERGVNRLPVVDDGRLVGIVTRADLVRAYVCSDDELRRTIREDVLRDTGWLDPASFAIVVEDGVASVSGRVERRSMAELIERSVAMVPGIVGFHADVGWQMDDSDPGAADADAVFPFGRR